MKKQPRHRRRRAKKIIDLYEGTVARHCSMVDALTDLMHYADKHQIDFNAAVRMAVIHHAAEIGQVS